GGNRPATGQPGYSLPSSRVLQITANSQATLLSVSAAPPDNTFPRPMRTFPFTATGPAAATSPGPLAVVFAVWGQSDADAGSAYWAGESLAALDRAEGSDENPPISQLAASPVAISMGNATTYLRPLYQVAERGDVLVIDLSVPAVAGDLSAPATDQLAD